MRNLCVALIPFVLTLGAWPMGAADAGIQLKVATVQFRSSFDVRQNSEKIAAHLRRLAGDGVQVAVFPDLLQTTRAASGRVIR